ncbi:heavy metal-responsive transcriptional regulator (plasmid) [Anabaena sp. FACHB-709]|uniref:Transcriptional regulator n=3 Tax=Nostocaceae TaxID=1162 RepID=A0A1Z4KVM5_ANAVA|nr:MULTISPECIES: heavy metal-responsive transcriptional regulator [Nostocales]BAY63570.1 transcriptional regulator [Calothrix brevissima NIES-22]BAY73081.1 transcriptional regulator [Trichormus variabilis NIES-23]BAY95107.1 transcriptional regulator [Microchaete diplosiphon NIES-3275]HBW31238.1 heavy metal-responsive transcriptional regulator [Nostoc sp. UBA8866]EKE97960.1 MerR family transcriptional regulator [Tolypothrix sp. PCC 7601]
MLVQEEPKLIGNVAKSSGVPIKTIRYYEELGLLKSSARTEGGFRLFNSDVLERLHFIKRAQSLGLSLSEIKEFLNVHDGGELPCEHIKIKLEDKIKAIDEQIHQLLILRQELSGLVSGWETIPENPEKTICPIIERN